MQGPLDGVRIIDLTSMISGPQATMILADQGADVIKVENPEGGDHTRAVSLDVFLPDMLGWTVLSQLKQNPGDAAHPRADRRDDGRGPAARPRPRRVLLHDQAHHQGRATASR